MKKLLLVISLLLPFLFSHVEASNVRANDAIIEECDSSNSIVRIVDNYNSFKGNGFVYKVDNKYSYIVSAYNIISEVNSYGVVFKNNSYKKATLLGFDSYNDVVIFRVDKEEGIGSVCKANSNYLQKGQLNYLKGYLDLETEFFRASFVIFANSF